MQFKCIYTPPAWLSCHQIFILMVLKKSTLWFISYEFDDVYVVLYSSKSWMVDLQWPLVDLFTFDNSKWPLMKFHMIFRQNLKSKQMYFEFISICWPDLTLIWPIWPLKGQNINRYSEWVQSCQSFKVHLYRLYFITYII